MRGRSASVRGSQHAPFRSGPFLRHRRRAGDLHGDGRPALVVPEETTKKLDVLLARADWGFAAPREIAFGPAPGFAAIGDLDGDGKADLAVAAQGQTTVTVALGNGDGTFQ